MKDIEMVYNFMTKLYNYWKWLIVCDNCLGWDMSIVEQSSNLVIRRGTAEDLEEMKDFLSECIRVNKYIYGEYDWSEFPLEDATFGTFQEVFGQGNLLLGLEEEELKGIVVITKKNAEKYKHVGNITLALKNEEDVSTIGKELIARMLLVCKGKGIIRKVNLRVREDHFKIQEIYKNLGFYEEGSLARDICLNGMFYSTILYGRSID